ncbi:hypothetical protein O3M35_000321 [Rhynocoris fuscipes]|uniref:Helicase ATP-binding domain-containing protein n=1 Tax=Rhynocoris fuscipes TaxID=488301 RepID=A0AAW1DR52_9HEMI
MEFKDSNLLTPPDDFQFPFQPYGIQLDFMKNLYSTIEEKKFGIFESPTGTGKSLSIICGALTWLRNHEEREVKILEDALKDIKLNTEPSDDWFSEQIKAIAVDSTVKKIKKQLEKVQIRNDSIKEMRKRAKEKVKEKIIPNSKQNSTNKEDTNNYDEFDDLLEEFCDNLDEDPQKDVSEEEEDEETVTRIIYCSRTHSQLSQFISEIEKTKFLEDTRLVHLASRQNYCINKKLQHITNSATLNEKCIEMQEAKESKSTKSDKEGNTVKKLKSSEPTKCPHMKSISDLSDIILSQVMDVEAVAQAGKKAGTCPYYATRTSIPLAQIVVLPYHSVLHKESREASGLKLKNSVVIIDEAHNLLETVSHIHSSQITGQELILAHSQLSLYKDRYLNKFSAVNLLYLNQVLHIIKAFIRVLEGKSEGCIKPSTNMFSVIDFILSSEIDNYNLYKLLAFCKQTKLAHKLQRFMDTASSFVQVNQNKKTNVTHGISEFIKELKQKKTGKKVKTAVDSRADNAAQSEINNSSPLEDSDYKGQPLLQITSFLSCLNQDYSDGRIVISKESTVGKSYIKYLLLEPARAIIDVIKEARSVILAGGTMEPISEFKERLFEVCGVSSDRINTFSCGHIVPKENILPIVVCKGPSGKIFDFSFNSRSSPEMINEIGRLLINVCNVVPSGVVCFFPSYEYEKEVYEYFDKNDVIKKISLKKKVFREPKKASDVERVLSDYTTAIKNSANKTMNGALLFSVVGGKLSEGLNFSDDLGRCVIIVGMPFPNIKSPELIEKMKYLEEHCGSNAGKIHYENLCMKAVNQSVGRSIRHRNDYSSVLLVDQRYSRAHICKLLPKWMHESLKVEQERFGPVLASLCKFFKFHERTSR